MDGHGRRRGAWRDLRRAVTITGTSARAAECAARRRLIQRLLLVVDLLVGEPANLAFQLRVALLVFRRLGERIFRARTMQGLVVGARDVHPEGRAAEVDPLPAAH